MSKSNYGKNMKLFTSAWMDEKTGSGYKTFRMMPVTGDCPFGEVICDRSEEGTVLVIMSKTKKQGFKMVPRVNEFGDPEPAKKPRPNGKNIKEQRASVEMYQEYYIMDPEEQEAFITDFAVNADNYDWKQYMGTAKPPAIMQNIEEQSALVGADGLALVK
jgi:hypothetical protein